MNYIVNKIEQKMHNHYFSALLTRVVHQPSSTSRRSGASQAVVMTICKNKEKKSAGYDCGAELEDYEVAEGSERTHASQEIINERSMLGGGRTKKQWLCSPGLYKVCTKFYFTARLDALRPNNGMYNLLTILCKFLMVLMWRIC